MKTLSEIVLLTLTATLLGGCANDWPYRGIYESTQARDQALKPPGEAAASPKPLDYDRYQAERQKLRGPTEKQDPR